MTEKQQITEEEQKEIDRLLALYIKLTDGTKGDIPPDKRREWTEALEKVSPKVRQEVLMYAAIGKYTTDHAEFRLG